MLLDDYLNEIKTTVDAVSSLVVNHSLTIDRRPQEQVHIFGVLIFMDASELHFREFIDASEGWLEKVAYSYHFQDKASQLLFRYDNARHKPALDFAEHKHCENSIIYAPAPHLRQVIQEAIVMQQLI